MRVAASEAYAKQPGNPSIAAQWESVCCVATEVAAFRADPAGGPTSPNRLCGVTERGLFRIIYPFKSFKSFLLCDVFWIGVKFSDTFNQTCIGLNQVRLQWKQN